MNEDFVASVRRFNKTYNLPINEKPVLLGVKRLKGFRITFKKEVKELDDVIEKYLLASELNEENTLNILTEFADWLGDIIVYATSESIKHGIDINQVLKIIMESNFSKLGADGKPIYDKNGKVLRGPNYIAPNQKIKELLKG